MLAHEVEHIKQDALYTIQSPTSYIKEQERKVNDAIIKKYNLDIQVLYYLIKGFDKWEICEHLDITYEIFDATFNYLQRKGKIRYEE